MSNVPGAFGKAYNCPCCKNPWNQSDAGEGAAPAGALFCNPCLADDKGYKGIDPANFDHSVLLKENFYYWSNGGWMSANPIPAEYSSWNTFIVLRDMNLDRLRTILDELVSSPNEKTAMLADYYCSFMDEAAIEAKGASVLSDLLNDVMAFKVDAASTTAKLHSKYGLSVFFAAHSSPDKSNSDHSLCALYQGGLGLPDRDYYFDADKAEKRAKYVEYIASLSRLLGASSAAGSLPQPELAKYQDDEYCLAAAKAVLVLETRIASTHLTRTASRDPLLTFNKMSVAELAKRSVPPLTWPTYLTYGANPPVRFDWIEYFEACGKPVEALGDINVASVDAVTGLATILDEYHGSEALMHYLRFHAVNSYAGHLPAAFVDAQFGFFEKELKGTAEQQPRWKRALQSLESALGEELGQLYVAKYFPSDAKQRALEIVEAVRDALRERLLEVEWMSEETRVEAMRKMEKFKVKIGFPDQWLDYSSMQVVRGQHFENVVAARRYAHVLELSRMNAPTDKARWFMTPQTVNAYYHPSLNEIVFPAAILQPPFFDPDADAAVQFGSLGAVVGHEMTHGFDDQGRKYDSAGNLRDWWCGTDGQEYEKRANVMISQAAKFEVHGLKLNGKLTCGENIADLGGVKLALRALKRHLAAEAAANGGRDPPLINGFTPEQRLFLAWSQAWRENVKKERAIQLVTLDPHGPNEMRCNGTLSNVAEFLEAFNISESDKMYLPPEERVDIW